MSQVVENMVKCRFRRESGDVTAEISAGVIVLLYDLGGIANEGDG